MSGFIDKLKDTYSDSFVITKILKEWDNFESHSDSVVGKFLAMFGINKKEDMDKLDNLLSALNRSVDKEYHDDRSFTIGLNDIEFVNNVKMVGNLYFDPVMESEVKVMSDLGTVMIYALDSSKLNDMSNPFALRGNWAEDTGLVPRNCGVDIVGDGVYGLNHTTLIGYNEDGILEASVLIEDLESDGALRSVLSIENMGSLESEDSPLACKIRSAAILEKKNKGCYIAGILNKDVSNQEKVDLRINGQVVSVKMKDLASEFERLSNKAKGISNAGKAILVHDLEVVKDAKKLGVDMRYGVASIDYKYGVPVTVILV